ncbi:Qb-SNARE 4 [Giardia muris]|uniref:Qb-SNARE 4 n=1 Tax=Giardia muris TaxID=5742 RepID=A0A4Z1T776_GIAMU|nr:Qb-SNARE 4 [Giardia muris]|eukprot:TNJ28409.1 Qb-SNARE 4 [Giardia muris]
MGELQTLFAEAAEAIESARNAIQPHIGRAGGEEARRAREIATGHLVQANGALADAKQEIGSLNGLAHQKAVKELERLREEAEAVRREIERLTGRPGKKQEPESLNDRARHVARKRMENVALLDDAGRNMQEANEIGEEIVTQLGKQNDQLRGINDMATGIDATVARGDEILKKMIKFERKMKLILWLLTVVFIGMCGVAFYVYHHNVPPPAPQPSPES